MHIFVILFFTFFLSSGLDAAEKLNVEVLKVREDTGAPAGSKNQPSETGSETKRFVNNGDETVLDKNTGLIWLKDANINKTPLPLQAARQYIQDMNEGKHPNFGGDNWRLPTINDLETLIDKSRSYPALPAVHPFINVQNYFYWSSSGSADIVETTWVLDMASGNLLNDPVSYCNFKYLWPVRSSVSQTRQSGTVLAGGLNDHGQLGNGATEEERESALSVIGLNDVIKVVAGAEHATAIKSDGSVWAWGRNEEGQLGDGTTEDRNIPVMVKGLWNTVDIAAGMYHTVALRSDGTVWTWGRNYYGQLGDGTIEDRRFPVQVRILKDIVRVSAGLYHTFALKSDGTVWAWGKNEYGQLGDGTTIDSRTPIQIVKINNVVAVSAGIHHSVALKSDGTVWAWGWNMYGLLGEERKEDSSAPTQVRGLSGIVDISAGMYHTLALKSDGTVWTWGKNEYGQLGTSITANASTVAMVEGINGVKKVTAGMYHSVALKSDNTVWVWGQDLKNKKEKSSPLQKKDLKGDFIAVSAGKYYTLSLISDESK